MPETTFYFVRHGETDYNRRHIMQGRRINSSLNETGRAQATALGTRLSAVDFDAVYTSSLRRTEETAAIATVSHTGVRRVQLEELEEMSWGIHEGRPIHEIHPLLEQLVGEWTNGIFDQRVPEGESILDVQQRALKAVDIMLEQEAGGTVLVVTHGRFLRVLLATLLEGYGLERMQDIDHANTGVNIVHHADDRFEALLLNSTTHLAYIETNIVV